MMSSINSSIAASAAQSMQQTSDVSKKKDADKAERQRKAREQAEKSENQKDGIFDEFLRVHTDDAALRDDHHARVPLEENKGRHQGPSQPDEDKDELLKADGGTTLDVLDTEIEKGPPPFGPTPSRLDLSA